MSTQQRECDSGTAGCILALASRSNGRYNARIAAIENVEIRPGKRVGFGNLLIEVKGESEDQINELFASVNNLEISVRTT